MTRPNRLLAMDITYISMARGLECLAVVPVWAPAGFLSRRLSITMEAEFCVDPLEDALARHGKPEIFDTDQGSQFTGTAFTGVLASNGIAISMQGKGAWWDNASVGRLWRSVKYEDVFAGPATRLSSTARGWRTPSQSVRSRIRLKCWRLIGTCMNAWESDRN
jgi:putative transposase